MYVKRGLFHLDSFKDIAPFFADNLEPSRDCESLIRIIIHELHLLLLLPLLPSCPPLRDSILHHCGAATTPVAEERACLFLAPLHHRRVATLGVTLSKPWGLQHFQAVASVQVWLRGCVVE